MSFYTSNIHKTEDLSFFMAISSEFAISRLAIAEPSSYLPRLQRVVLASGHKPPGKVEFRPLVEKHVRIQALPIWFDEERVQDYIFGSVSSEFVQKGCMLTDWKTAMQLTESMARIKGLACILDELIRPGVDPYETALRLRYHPYITRDMMRYAEMGNGTGLFMGKVRDEKYAEDMLYAQLNHETITIQGVAAIALGVNYYPLIVSSIEQLPTPQPDDHLPKYARHSIEQIVIEHRGSGPDVCGVLRLSDPQNPVLRPGTFSNMQRMHFRGHVQKETVRGLEDAMAKLFKAREGMGLPVYQAVMQDIINLHQDNLRDYMLK